MLVDTTVCIITLYTDEAKRDIVNLGYNCRTLGEYNVVTKIAMLRNAV